ncbi:hypothetical protein [Candidatus Protochlamydia phocaeensis]|uniref:hypothetical protein n=1 Tax=Candidatus Protochlamydia phocaeensis TaxID=1414722 RepID=UPI00083923B9|nr:hypothetical protein [Candidatus Protochlamydia phocaeensis]
MISLRDMLFFLAGAEFLHTLSHLLLPFFIKLPLDMRGFTFTSTFNAWAIIINGALTILLLWWASQTKIHKEGK